MIRLSLFLLSFYLFLSCAQFIPPTGGDKDEEPPKIITTDPPNQSINYHGRTFYLEFDELIDATKLRQELIITPEPPGNLDLKIKPYSVYLVFDQPFKDSTTYTLNFRNGIKDLNERNPARNLKLVFSTTNKIDSLQVKGNIKDLWTGQIAEEITVGLYDITKPDTIPLLQQKPDYFIKTDTLGNYLFENIKSSSYRILAFDDENSNLIYDQAIERFGFILDTLLVNTNLSDINIKLYQQNRTQPQRKKTLSRQINYEITYSKTIDSLNVNFLNNDSLTYLIQDDKLLFFNHPYTKDSILTNIIVSDSLGQITNDTLTIKFRESFNDKKYKPQNLPLDITPKRTKTLEPPFHYIINFTSPITQLDTSKLSITLDTTSTSKYSYHWLDNSNTKLCINIPEVPLNQTELIIKSSFATNYKSDTSNTYTLIHKVYPQSDYGLIEGHFGNDSTHKIIELIDSKNLEVAYKQYVTHSFIFNKVKAANYFIRVIMDTNQNKRWDTSDFYNSIPPEDIYIYNSLLRLKANFELRNIEIPIR